MSGKTVLLVVEIAETSLQFDIGRKARLYLSFGVRELWVIDAVEFTLRAYRVPSSEGYREMQNCCACEAAVPRFAPTQFALKLEDLSIENDDPAEDLLEAAIRDTRGLGWEGDLDDRR